MVKMEATIKVIGQSTDVEQASELHPWQWPQA